MTVLTESTLLDNVAKAIYETVFDEKWSALRVDSIERAIYRDCARAALVMNVHWAVEHPPEPALKLVNTPPRSATAPVDASEEQGLAKRGSTP